MDEDGLATAARRYVPPPALVQAALGPKEQLFVAFSADADAEEEENGQLRAIGWVIGCGGEIESYKQRRVRPREETQPAQNDGEPAEQILNEFLAEVLEATWDGGRLLAHDLTLQASIVERELRRCDMTALRHHWGSLARHGLCLKDEEIGRWLQDCYRQEGSAAPSSNALALNRVLQLLLPEHARPRDCVERAALYLKAERALQELAVPPCRRPGGCHVWKRVFASGMRDNGEYQQICRECGRTF